MTGQPTEQRAQGRQSAEDHGYETASRVSLGVSLLVLGVLVGLVVYTYATGGSQPAEVIVEPKFDELRTANGQHYLPVTIENVGGSTAEALLVELTLTPPSGPEETAEITIDFLAGGESTDAIATFTNDPTQGTLVPTYSFLETQ